MGSWLRYDSTASPSTLLTERFPAIAFSSGLPADRSAGGAASQPALKCVGDDYSVLISCCQLVDVGYLAAPCSRSPWAGQDWPERQAGIAPSCCIIAMASN